MIGLPKTTEFNKRIPKQKFYENIDIELKKHTIACYGCYKNSLQSKYLIFMREIKDSFEFDKSYIYKTLDVIIKFHKQYYGKKECYDIYRLNYYTNHDYKRSRRLLSYIFHKFDKLFYWIKLNCFDFLSLYTIFKLFIAIKKSS